jgi:hypothetical protein
MTPTLREELDRKAVETLEKIEHDRASGRITAAQYDYGIDLLWSSWAGLISSDIIILLEIAAKARAPVMTQTYLRNQPGTVFRITNHHDGKVSLSTWDHRRPTPSQREDSGQDFIDDPRPNDRANEYIASTTAALIRSGFTKI